MLCRADPDLCIGVYSTTFRTGTEHLRYMAWSCDKQRRNSDCGSQSAAKGTSTAESTTAADGSFSLAALPVGEYKLTIVADGTTATYAQPITLIPESPAVVITVSNSREITVATQQQTDQKGGEKLSSEKVNELPLNGRDFSTLLLLAAGTMTDANGATNFTQQFAINGQRGVEAVFAMDGADISDPEMGGSTFTNFNVDAIQDLQSSSGWMPAEIGRGRRFHQHRDTVGSEWVSRIILRVHQKLRS